LEKLAKKSDEKIKSLHRRVRTLNQLVSKSTEDNVDLRVQLEESEKGDLLRKLKEENRKLTSENQEKKEEIMKKKEKIQELQERITQLSVSEGRAKVWQENLQKERNEWSTQKQQLENQKKELQKENENMLEMKEKHDMMLQKIKEKEKEIENMQSNTSKYIEENTELKLKIVSLQESLDQKQGENFNVHNEIHQLKLKMLRETLEPKTYKEGQLQTELKRWQSTCAILEEQMKMLRKEELSESEKFKAEVMDTISKTNLRLERMMNLEIPPKRDHKQLEENVMKLEVRWRVKNSESEAIYSQMEQIMANDSKMDSLFRYWETRIELAQLQE